MKLNIKNLLCGSCAAAFLVLSAVAAPAQNIVQEALSSSMTPAEADAAKALDAAATQNSQSPQSSEITPPFAPSDSDMEADAARLKKVSQSLDEWNLLKPEDAAARFGVTAADITARVEILTTLKNLYPRISDATSRNKQEEATLAKQTDDAAAPETGLTQKPPYSLAFYDAFIGTLDDVRQQAEDSADAAQTTSVIDASKKDAEDKQAAWRLARDTQLKDPSPVNSWACTQTALQAEAAAAQLILDRFDVKMAQLNATSSTLKLRSLTTQMEYIRKNLDLSEKGFAAQIKTLDDSINALSASRPQLLRSLQRASSSADRAQRKIDTAADEKGKDQAALELSMAMISRESSRIMLELMQKSVSLLTERKRTWTLRYDLFHKNIDLSTLPKRIEKMQAGDATLESELSSLQKDLLSLQTKLSMIDKALSSAAQANVNLYKKTRGVVQQAIDADLNYIAMVVNTKAQNQYFVQELTEEYHTAPLLDKARAVWRNYIKDFLNLELWESGGYAVRLQEFLIALMLISFGSWVAKRLVHMLTLIISARFHLDETGRRTFDRFVFYLAFIGIFLAALKIVNIPLTAFAFLGGAVAIAIGFGAQNIFQNLMSGIILTLNRPFRLGDIIEVGNILGVVSDLGLRTTLVRTFDEKEIIVPNSQLLDNQLTNWSLSNGTLRTSVTVGVAYGTPAAKVKDCLIRTALSHPKVLKYPMPWVYFADFADSSLVFTLFFWVNVREGDEIDLEVRGQLRESIQKRFDEAGIEMPFPQMDVHFNRVDLKPEE